jgi:porin
MRPILRYAMIWAMALPLAASPALAEGDDGDTGESRPGLGGPDQVDNQLASDAGPKEPLLKLTFLDGYFAWKSQVKEDTGFSFGLDYSTVFFGANESLGEDSAAAGMFRFFGTWDLVGRKSGNAGGIVYKVEHRHSYTSSTPKFFGFDLGYAGLFAAPWSDEVFRVTNLYGRQRLANQRFVFLAGFLDATVFVDVYGLASPWLHFMNLTFSTGAAAIALPNDGLLGAAVSGWISDNLYGIASFGDNGSDPTDVFSGFDRFFNANEYFTSVEVGWTTAKDRAYFDNVHLTWWHSDKKSEIGDPDGWGMNASGTWYLKDKWMPFLRGGFTEDAGSLLEASVSAGAGYQWVPGSDLIGFAVNWGKPNETTWGPGLDDQYTIEAFWRWQVGEQLAITPDIQLLVNPANNPDADQIWVYGIRSRLAI